MEKAVFLYITKWVHIEKHYTGISFEIKSSIDSPLGLWFSGETSIIHTNYGEIYLTLEKIAQLREGIKKIYNQKLEAIKKILSRDHWAHPIELVYNQEWRTTATVCFGGAPDREKMYFKGVNGIKTKAPLSPEEIIFLSMLLNGLGSAE